MLEKVIRINVHYYKSVRHKRTSMYLSGCLRSNPSRHKGVCTYVLVLEAIYTDVLRSLSHKCSSLYLRDRDESGAGTTN